VDRGGNLDIKSLGTILVNNAITFNISSAAKVDQKYLKLGCECDIFGLKNKQASKSHHLLLFSTDQNEHALMGFVVGNNTGSVYVAYTRSQWQNCNTLTTYETSDFSFSKHSKSI
jgi:hypothetical protein